MNTIFQLIFKKGNVLNSLYFTSSDLKTAVAKGKEYCEKRQLKFIFVSQWLFDIDEMINFDPTIYENEDN